MRVLIAYASKHGATAGIAERIGDTLTRAGHEVTVHPITDAGSPAGLTWPSSAAPSTWATGSRVGAADRPAAGGKE